MTNTQTVPASSRAARCASPGSDALLGEGHWLRWWRAGPGADEVRRALGATSRWDIRRTQWLVARVGFRLDELALLTPGERSELRRCLGVPQAAVMLLVYAFAYVAIVLSWAFSTSGRNGGPFATGSAALGLLLAGAVAFVVVWRGSLWVTSRWGEPDRELGLVARRIHIKAGRLARGSVGRLPGRRALILLGRQVPGLLLRAESDPAAAAGLQADLRERVDPRAACRHLLLEHLRGDLLEPRMALGADPPPSIASTIPQWLTQLAAMTPALLLILGFFGYQANGRS